LDRETGGGGIDGQERRLTREESRARTRERLIRAAAAVFAERGFYGASIEDIAERAGFSKGAFYSNFESKEDLFLAVLDEHLDADMTALRALAEHPSLPEFLAFIGGRAASQAADGERWRLLTAEFWLHALRNRELVPKLAARQRAARTVLASVITKLCQQAGIALAAPADDLASVMLAVDDGLMLQESLDPGAVPVDLRLRTMLLFVSTVARPSGP
jgi:AcrR family transcriptional regulator